MNSIKTVASSTPTIATLLVTSVLLAMTGCGNPVKAITSNTIFIPRPVSANVSADVVTSIEKGPKTQPIIPTVVQPAQASAGSNPTTCRRVALIDVDGLLVNAQVNRSLQDVDNPVALFREKVNAATNDPNVAAIVVRINSPGGGVVATDLMFHELMKARQRLSVPIVTYIMESGTGGAYYLATAGDIVMAHPNAITGGIGVVFNYFNLTDAMGQYGAYHAPITAGEDITMGSYTNELSDEAEEHLTGMAEVFHHRFVDTVIERRPRISDEGDEVLQGRVYAAPQARDSGLIDEVGYLEAAIDRASEMAGVPGAEVVMYHRQYNPPRSIYADDGLNAVAAQLFPLSVPGLERSHLPGFLYIWQVDPALERLGKP